MKIDDCIGKFVYGTDEVGKEYWLFNIRGTYQVDYYGKAIVGCNLYTTSQICGWYLHISGTEARWEGEFYVLEVYTTDTELLAHAMRRVRTALISEASYDPNLDDKSETIYSKYVRLNLLKIKEGNYISGIDGSNRKWLFDFARIVDNREIDVRAQISSLGTELFVDTSKKLLNIFLNDVTVYTGPQLLLEDLRDHIKEELGKASGYKW